MAKTIEEQLEEHGWHWLNLIGPSVDMYGHRMENGDYFEPTFKRNFKLMGLRSDGTYFEVNIPFEKEVELDFLKMVGAQFKNAIMTFESFRTCECVLGKNCEKHP